MSLRRRPSDDLDEDERPAVRIVADEEDEAAPAGRLRRRPRTQGSEEVTGDDGGADAGGDVRDDAGDDAGAVRSRRRLARAAEPRASATPERPAAPTEDPSAGEPREKKPLYPRLLRLQHIQPNAWQRAALGEGAIGVGVLLAMADLATAWGIVVLPVAVAAIVKAHDALQGLLDPREDRARETSGDQPVPDGDAPPPTASEPARGRDGDRPQRARRDPQG